MFILVDCNNFYVSCERVFRPDLLNKPVAVLSNNDGCIIARSNEVKALGVPMGAPIFKYKKLLSEHNATVFSANFPLYGDMSQRVMSILEEFNTDLEVYSIDEAFLKLPIHRNLDLYEFAETIRYKISKWTGIPVSIGIAPTKSLAKVANRIAKKKSKTGNYIHIIDTLEKNINALKELNIEDVWGIGRRLTIRLNKINVKTAYQFTQLNESLINKNMGIVGLRLKKDLQGIPTLDIEDIKTKKSIAATRTFETTYTEFEQVQERVITFAVSCAEKLRKQNSCCNTIMVFIYTNRHRKDTLQYFKNIVMPLPYPTNSTIELAEFADAALKKIFKKGCHYKKAGVIVQDFSEENLLQQSLFENRNERHIPLMKAIDKINSSFGQHKIHLASQNNGKMWKMKQDNLSPSYTTRLSDIITVKC